ncbi:branched-chain amino acid ABC transporter permease [Blastococcus sp. Marseille-P5729]|uniref:branched-chain amino acid ABC transporter permease n=1 Tax=Blastococcus sp. Marseille-P5729 TaxID=2086582 RepID=UPI000D112F48|nr:branched-chain amino acid ABC transporter permease [Blastococcus sp. Marseille-P5729]
MSTFFQVLITGLGRGAVYALLALGFVIIYKATETVNFAHGSIALVGGYIVFVLRDSAGLPWIVAALGGILTAALLALWVERALLSASQPWFLAGIAIAATFAIIQLRSDITTLIIVLLILAVLALLVVFALKGTLASHDSLAILTIGLDTILFIEIIRRLGVSDNPNLFPSVSPLRIGDVSIQGIYLVSMIAALIIIGTFFIIFQKTNWGTSMRAQAENKEAASLMGIRSGRVTASAWIVGGMLAGVAILFIASPSFAGSGLSATSHAIALAAFPAAIIGGLTSTEGAIVGGIIVGLTNSFGEFYVDKLFATVAVYIVMVLVLVFKPSGLFGKVEQRRV